MKYTKFIVGGIRLIILFEVQMSKIKQCKTLTQTFQTWKYSNLWYNKCGVTKTTKDLHLKSWNVHGMCDNNEFGIC